MPHIRFTGYDTVKLAIRDAAARQAARNALFSELLMFADVVGKFDPGACFQIGGADALSVPLLIAAEPSAGWQEVRARSTSGGSYVASVTIVPNGALNIAWYDDSGTDYEIYVRRWNGAVAPCVGRH